MMPYIGVTGFTKPEQVAAALEAFQSGRNRQLMVGVLASWKSLRDIPMKPKWAAQTPSPRTIPRLFFEDPRVLNLVHLSAEENHELRLAADAIRVRELAGGDCHGIQLNAAWPYLEVLENFRDAFGCNGQRVVLQIGQEAVDLAGGTPIGVTHALGPYAGLIDDVLFDPSGGRGEPFDPAVAREFLLAIADRDWHLGLGVAGGLGPDTLHLVEPLIREFPDLSIDAQGRLRNEKNELDLEVVKSYLARALELFG